LAVSAVDGVDAVGVSVLPDAEVAIDESVMQPKGRVGRGPVDILHDGTDAVVSPSVGATFSAGPHAVVVGPGVALVDVGRVAVGRLGAVAVASQAVNLVVRAGTDVDGKVGELAIGNTVAAESNASKPAAGEDGRLGKATSIPGLVEPRDGVIEAALATEQVLEGPGEVSVPQQELGVAMDVGRQDLVESDEILVTTPGAGELARGSPAHQTLDGIDEALFAIIFVLIPFGTDADVGAGCARSKQLGRVGSRMQKLGHVSSDLGQILHDTVDGIGDTQEIGALCSSNVGRLELGMGVLKRNRSHEPGRVEDVDGKGRDDFPQAGEFLRACRDGRNGGESGREDGGAHDYHGWVN